MLLYTATIIESKTIFLLSLAQCPASSVPSRHNLQSTTDERLLERELAPVSRNASVSSSSLKGGLPHNSVESRARVVHSCCTDVSQGLIQAARSRIVAFQAQPDVVWEYIVVAVLDQPILEAAGAAGLLGGSVHSMQLCFFSLIKPCRCTFEPRNFAGEVG